jgi:hypothetical protein
LLNAKAAKDANPTTLLTRFAEELRRAPEAGEWFRLRGEERLVFGLGGIF